jgi:hypothetical protein
MSIFSRWVLIKSLNLCHGKYNMGNSQIHSMISVILVVDTKDVPLYPTVESIFLNGTKTTHIDLIIIDSGIDDEATDYAQKLSGDFPGIVRHIKADGDITGAINRAVPGALGDYICTMKAGDIINAAGFSAALSVLQAHPHFALVAFADSSPAAEIDVRENWKAIPTSLSGVVVRKSFLLQHPVNKKLGPYSDYDVLSSLLLAYPVYGAVTQASYARTASVPDELVPAGVINALIDDWMLPLIAKTMENGASLPAFLQYYFAHVIMRIAVSGIEIESDGLESRARCIDRLSEIASYIQPECFFEIPLIGASQKMALLHILEDQDFGNIFKAMPRNRLSFDGYKTKSPKLRITAVQRHFSYLAIEGFAFVPRDGSFHPEINGLPAEWEEVPELTRNIYIFGRGAAVYRGFRLLAPAEGGALKIGFWGKQGNLVFSYSLQCSRSAIIRLEKLKLGMKGDTLVREVPEMAELVQTA